ncbi:MAG: hypothetical protein JWQ07_4263 [Ramlibacter sp.]|nr:hypothetical protein [Ramlibacter sp.]
MERVIRVLALIATVAATGCASVAGGNVQKMYVQAQAADGSAVTGADCALSNDKGTWRIKSPGDTSIVRSNKPMEVKCEKAPLPQGMVSVESGTRGAMFGNIILGGVVGAVIDHSSGAAYEYPEIVRVVMGQMTAMAFPRAPAAPTTDPSRPRTLPQPTAMQLAEPHGTGFARLEDVDAVPHLGPQGRQAYRDWVRQPVPRAFALAPGGAYFPAYGLVPADASLPSDPAERALAGCSRNAKVSCKLYAVNNTVVWSRDAVPPPVVAVAPPAPAPVPVVARAAEVLPQPVQPRALASGYARVDDVDAVPYISDKARDSYREWVTKPTPRAFAVSDQGHWAATWGLTPADPNASRDPSERALTVCQQRSKGLPCRLYAVNGAVVWTKEARAD